MRKTRVAARVVETGVIGTEDCDPGFFYDPQSRYQKPGLDRLGRYDPQSRYRQPAIERLGTFREITLAGGCLAMADGTNPYHRYDPAGATCGFPNG